MTSVNPLATTDGQDESPSVNIEMGEEKQLTAPKPKRQKSWQGASSSALRTWHNVLPASLCWEDVKVTVKGKEKGTTRDILKGVSGMAVPGRILVIVGPSGAGKTTLLKVLSGQLNTSGGKVYYEGQEKVNTLADNDVMGFNGNSAIVPQEPSLFESLTVEETLHYAAQLKVTDDSIDITERVDNIIKYLGLESCRNTKIGGVFYSGISGGEKRRVSIGVELVSQPAIIFMDEPTTNLDSTSAYALITVANKLTKLNHTVIMTLHQPSSRIYEMLCERESYLMILEAGRCVYNGLMTKAVDFFSTAGYPVPEFTNPPDHFLDVVNSNFHESSANADKCAQTYKELYFKETQETIQNLKENAKPINRVNLQSSNFLKSLWILLQRNFKNNMRNPATFMIRIVMYTGLCICLGSLYWNIGEKEDDLQDRISILFFVAAFLTFMSISGMPAFVDERAIFVRERMNNHYGPLVYSIASFLSSLPWIFIIALSSTFFIHFMIQARPGGYHFGIYLANLFVALVTVESMMVAISAIAPVFMIGLAAGAGLLGLFMILCGFFLLPKNIPPGWKWAHHAVSFHTYSFQIFMVNEFRGFSGNGINGIDGKAVLKSYSMDDVSIGFNFGILLIMCFVYRVLFYVFLRFFNKRLK